MLSPEQVTRVYSAFPTLQYLSATDRKYLEASTTIATFERGATLFRIGDTCTAFLLCLTGSYNVMSTARNNRQLVLQTVLPGATCAVSTLALVNGRPYLATAVATTKLECIVISETTFATLFNSSPQLRRLVMDDYLTLLPCVLRLLEQLAFSRVDQRLAGSLLAQASPSGHVGKTHQQIATDIGTVREIVTHQLSDWSHAGWVKTKRGAVQILNRGALSGYLAEPSLSREQHHVLLTARLI